MRRRDDTHTTTHTTRRHNQHEEIKMCGLFSFASVNGSSVNMNLLRRVAVETESRGRDAFGFAWIDRRGRMHSYKQPGRISHHLNLLNYCRDAQAIIGHCRWATRSRMNAGLGDYRNNINNHPHAIDGGFFVHNGTVENSDQLQFDHDVLNTSECDSETIGLVADSLHGSRSDRLRRTIMKTQGTIAVIALTTGPRQMTIAKRGRPLHVTRTDGGVYFASLGGVLPKCGRVRDNSFITIVSKKGEIRYEAKSIVTL